MTKPTVLNTRPKALLKVTHEAFVKQGFKVIDFPCIEIVAGTNSNTINCQLAAIQAQDVLVFTSQHAVTHAFNSFDELNITKNTVVIAVGTKTAQVLEQNYSGNIWTPQQQNSEGVIDLLQGLVNCPAIKLISAENGRSAIRDFANKKGIAFEQINVYQRQLPPKNKDAILLISQTQQLFILATSVTTLNNLQILLKDIHQQVLSFPVVCSSSRIEKAAQRLGFNQTINVNTANPEQMAQELTSFSKHN